MDRSQTRHQVHMVVYATNNLRDAVRAPDDSTQVGMQSRSPFGPNEGSSFLRRENNVIMQTEKSRTHGSYPFLAHLRSANHSSRVSGGLRYASTAGYYLAALRAGLTPNQLS